jgi:DNA-binding SARP family transcriptional activator
MMRTATRDLAIWDSVDASAGLSDTERLTAARGRTLSLQLYSFALAMRGEVSAALPSMARCLDSARASGDRWLLSVMTMRGALMHFMVGDFDAAKRDWDAAVPELRRMGEWWFLSLALEGMANNALAMGDAPGAMHHARESILVLRPEPDAWFISRSLDTMGHILLMRAPASAAQRVEQHRLAAQLLGAAESLRRRCGAGIIGPDLERHDRMYAALRESLGATAFDEEHVAGSTLSLSDVFALMDDDRLHATSPDGESVAQAERHTVVLRVLGPFQFSRGDRVHSGEASPVGKVRELLLFLVLHDHVSKEAVGLALWPDASAAQVRNAFHVTLHHLRRLLGPEAWIVFDRDGYRLDRTPAGGIVLDIDVDAVLSWSTRLRQATRRQQRLGLDDLAAARAAFDRSRGDLAQNVVAEDWLVVHQDRVRTAWADGMDALAQQYHALEQHADVVAVCEQLVEREPLREGAHRLLMQALAAMGERARALAHFDTMSAVLQREVGAKPAAETRALAEQIRR